MSSCRDCLLGGIGAGVVLSITAPIWVPGSMIVGVLATPVLAMKTLWRKMDFENKYEASDKRMPRKLGSIADLGSAEIEKNEALIKSRVELAKSKSEMIRFAKMIIPFGIFIFKPDSSRGAKIRNITKKLYNL